MGRSREAAANPRQGQLPLSLSLCPLNGGETLLTHKKKATRAEEEAERSRCAEIFSPFSKG